MYYVFPAWHSYHPHLFCPDFVTSRVISAFREAAPWSRSTFELTPEVCKTSDRLPRITSHRVLLCSQRPRLPMPTQMRCKSFQNQQLVSDLPLYEWRKQRRCEWTGQYLEQMTCRSTSAPRSPKGVSCEYCRYDPWILAKKKCLFPSDSHLFISLHPRS